MFFKTMPYEAVIKNALLTIFFSNIGYIINEVMFFLRQRQDADGNPIIQSTTGSSHHGSRKTRIRRKKAWF